jgi:hypothetical protein
MHREIPAKVGHDHRAAWERNGDAATKLDARGGERGHGHGDERIVRKLRRGDHVVAFGFGAGSDRTALPPVVDGQGVGNAHAVYRYYVATATSPDWSDPVHTPTFQAEGEP